MESMFLVGWMDSGDYTYKYDSDPTMWADVETYPTLEEAQAAAGGMLEDERNVVGVWKVEKVSVATGGDYGDEILSDDEPYEDPVQADSDVLASAGWGTDEDYGCYGD